MLKIKMIAGLFLVTVVLIVISGTALAAPNAETFTAAATTTPPAPVVGTVQTITIKTDANNVPPWKSPCSTRIASPRW